MGNKARSAAKQRQANTNAGKPKRVRVKAKRRDARIEYWTDPRNAKELRIRLSQAARANFPGARGVFRPGLLADLGRLSRHPEEAAKILYGMGPVNKSVVLQILSKSSRHKGVLKKLWSHRK